MAQKNWSMTVGEMRAAIDGVPDDYEIVLDNAEVDDCEISNVSVDIRLDPALDCPGLLVLRGGQIISSEYEYHARLDACLQFNVGWSWGNVPLYDHEFKWVKPS